MSDLCSAAAALLIIIFDSCFSRILPYNESHNHHLALDWYNVLDLYDIENLTDSRMQKPSPTRGMHHVALNVVDLEHCEKFYVELLGMSVEWRPDKDSVYLCSGNDNLALHRLPEGMVPEGTQRLDHIGFILNEPEQVDTWHEFLLAHNIKMKTSPRTHRDGARSFYCEDPEGNVVQMIYHKPLKHL